jgi:hypothetical protein
MGLCTWNASIPNCVEVGAVTIKCYINGISSNIQSLIVQRLVDIANELEG